MNAGPPAGRKTAWTWGDLAALTALGLLALAKLGPATLGSSVLAGGDHGWINLPGKLYTRQALLAGEIPFWNKALSAGTPHLAQGEAGIFYLGNLMLYTPLDFFRSYAWTVAVHLIALAWGAYLLLRHYRCSRHASALFAALFACSPYVLLNLPTSNFFQTFWFVPLLLLAVEWAREGRAAAAGLLGGLLLGQQVLIGRPSLTLYTWMTLGVIGAAHVLIAERRGRTAADLAVFFGLAGGIGALIGAVQLLPTLDFLPASTRPADLAGAFSARGGWLSPARLFATYVFPLFPLDVGRGPAYVASNPYVGVVPVALILLGAGDALRRDRARTLPLVAGGVFALLLAMGPGLPGFRLLFTVPPLSLLRYPGRALPVFLCLAFLLAAMSWTRMIGQGRRPGPRSVAVTALLLGAGLAGFAVHARGIAAPVVPASQLVLQLLPVAAVAAWPRWRRRRGAWEVALVAACVIQLAPLWLWYGNHSRPRQELLAAFAPLAPLDGAPEGERRTVVQGMARRDAPGQNPPSLGNGALLAGAHVVNEYSQFTWGDWRGVMQREVHPYSRGDAPLPPDPALCDWIGLRWLMFDESSSFTDRDWRPAPAPPGQGMRLWRRAAGPGSAGILHEVVRLEPGDAGEILGLARSGAIDLRRQVVLHDPDAPDPGPAPGDAQATLREEPAGVNAFRFRAATSSPAYLLVRDHDAPGWQAFLDGRPVPHYRANGMFKAVPLPAGEHVVELRYRPPSFALGAGLSLAGYALLAVGLVLRAARRRRIPRA